MTGKKKADKTMRIDIDPATVGNRHFAASGVIQQQNGEHAWLTCCVQRNTPFYKLLESVYDAVLITTRKGQILECNERACEFFIMLSSAVAGLNVISFISGATETLIDAINQNLTDKKYTLVEARCKRSDGTSFAAEIAVNKVDLDAQGQLCFFIRDITIRLQAQNALEDAVERLQAHDRARMEFVSNVSHELRTPLTSMIYAVNNMLRGVVGPMPEKAIDYLQRLQSDSHRLLATINDILDLRQIENKTLMLTKRVVPLALIVRQGVETLQVQADAKRIAIVFEFGARELFSCCDVQKIVRVVLNLVGNAIKFTPAKGNIKITLTQHSEKSDLAVLTVSDTGMGISAEDLPNVSQRYFRVGDHVSGSGLGLAISKEIVGLHGGTMDFASPVPNTTCGTAVYVTLPLASNPMVIAVLHDEETTAAFSRQVIAKGYQLKCVESAQTALDNYLETQASVFVLDHRNTDIDSREVILQIRGNPKTKRLPIIVLGVQELDRQEVELYRQFNVFYLTMPWRENELTQQLALAVFGASIYS